MSRRLRSIDESWYRKPLYVRERVSSGGIVVRFEDARTLVALVREPEIPQYVIPKGGVKEGEALEAAARREIEEEAGFTDLTLVDNLGTEERLSYGKECWQITHYFLFTTRQTEGRPTDFGHRDGPWWFPIDELPSMLWPEQWELIEAHRERIESLRATQ